MRRKLPQVGDIWCFNGLGREFCYLVAEYIVEDPLFYDADSVMLLSFTKGEKSPIREGASKMQADTRRWTKVA